MKRHASTRLNGNNAATSGDPVVAPVESDIGAIPNDQNIAERAYQRWLDRGCPDGSPDEDWFEAERELRTHSAGS